MEDEIRLAVLAVTRRRRLCAAFGYSEVDRVTNGWPRAALVGLGYRWNREYGYWLPRWWPRWSNA